VEAGRDESEVALRIRYWREKAGLTPNELADKVGVDRSSVSKWETGAAFPGTANMIRIAEACGIGMRKFWAPLDAAALAAG
jgi:transcriptional regulator with XRE-family HTH domain